MDDESVLPELEGYPSLMTVEEVSHVLRLHTVSVLRLLRNEELPGFKVGREWRVRRADLQSVLLREWGPRKDGSEDEA